MAETTGHILALQVDIGVWLCKDIADFSNIEFLLWLSQVFPVDLSKEIPENYSTIESRMTCLNAAMNWHQLQMFVPRK